MGGMQVIPSYHSVRSEAQHLVAMPQYTLVPRVGMRLAGLLRLPVKPGHTCIYTLGQEIICENLLIANCDFFALCKQ